ncbi:MAG: DUF4124 domain-containing protein [Myxococcota bacterium]
MRTLALILAVVASPALGQVRGFIAFGPGGGHVPLAPPPSTGTWGGYVSGFREPGVSTGTWTGYVGGFQPNRGFVPPVYPVAPGYPVYRAPYVVGPVWMGTTVTTDEVREREREAAQREFAIAEAARIEREANERRLAESRQREAEERQRVAEERQRVAEERQRAAEERLIAEQALATQRALIELQRAALEKQAEAAKAPPAAAKPETPGNDVYRWTDDEGVVHYSTRVPAEVASKAVLIGGKKK